MNRVKLILLVSLLALAISLCYGCEQYAEADEINGLIKENGLSIILKAEANPGGYTIEKIYENADDYYVKIDVTDTYSLRGNAEIKPGDKYKLSFTLKNINANPVISYSCWKMPITVLRHYTFKGENGNPPSSETQEFYDDWITFEETFETHAGENSFQLSLLSREGTFYIKDINIEQLQ